MSGKTLKEAAAEKLGHGITVRGIWIEGVTPEVFDDFELMEAFASMTDPDADNAEKLRATAKIAPTIFGSKQWKRIKAELREQNDGKLPTDTVMEFVGEAMDVLEAKNS